MNEKDVENRTTMYAEHKMLDVLQMFLSKTNDEGLRQRIRETHDEYITKVRPEFDSLVVAENKLIRGYLDAIAFRIDRARHGIDEIDKSIKERKGW